MANSVLDLIEEAAAMLETPEDLRKAWDILKRRQEGMQRSSARLLKVGDTVRWESNKRAHRGEVFTGKVEEIGRTGVVRVTDQHKRQWRVASSLLTKGGAK